VQTEFRGGEGVCQPPRQYWVSGRSLYQPPFNPPQVRNRRVPGLHRGLVGGQLLEVPGERVQFLGVELSGIREWCQVLLGQ
jgi:hypothetical protein